MPKIVDADTQREEIRSAARRVFAARGVGRTGLAHVAEAARMGRSTLYHYYPDRDALVQDLARELLREEKALFAAALRGEGSPMERIERLAMGIPHVFDAWVSIGRVLVDLRNLDRARFRRFFRSVRRDLAAVVSEGQKQGEIDASLDPDLAAATLIGTIDGMLLQRLVDPGVLSDTDRVAHSLVQTMRKVLSP
jgi:AcrR family transcriptional regulator